MDARVSLALRHSTARPIPADRLARDLKLSPQRLAAALGELSGLGFEIEDHPMMGLRLAAAPPALFAEELATGLVVRRIGRHIQCVAETSSTNDLAWAAAAHGQSEADGTAVFSEHQSSGRGRRGNRWVAPPHSSVLASIVLWMAGGPGIAAVLTRVAAVGVAEAIESVVPLKVGIKWPNDLLIDDRKVGGILVEARPSASGLGPVVIGVGINCTQTLEDLPQEVRTKAASLAIMGEEVDRTLLARSLLERLDAVLAQADDPAGQEMVRQAASGRCRTLGRRITLIEGTTTYTGEVVDLDPDYGLILRLPEGGLRRFPAMTSHLIS
jgi:BirA family transcriptional regulator, biotin operon repressor / biotin---[acetyl-CoA-carboxylase] ligase